LAVAISYGNQEWYIVMIHFVSENEWIAVLRSKFACLGFGAGFYRTNDAGLDSILLHEFEFGPDIV
jgi:hypothetical protein